MNNRALDQNLEVELRFQLPNIKDIDGVVSYDKLLIEDKTMNKQI